MRKNEEQDKKEHNHSAQNTENYVNTTNKYSSPVQQINNQTFMKKFNSEKIDTYFPKKSFHSESEIPSSG